MAEKNIFTYLNAIYLKHDIPYDKKLAPAYMLSMWLSHDKGLIEIVNAINEFQFSLPDCLLYKYYQSKVPLGRRFIKWTKKDEPDKKEKEKLDKMREEMLLSKREMSKYKAFTNLMENGKSSKKKNVENASSLFL